MAMRRPPRHAPHSPIRRPRELWPPKMETPRPLRHAAFPNSTCLAEGLIGKIVQTQHRRKRGTDSRYNLRARGCEGAAPVHAGGNRHSRRRPKNTRRTAVWRLSLLWAINRQLALEPGLQIPLTISSITAATPGIRSSISPGRSCPSRAAIGRPSVTQCEEGSRSRLL